MWKHKVFLDHVDISDEQGAEPKVIKSAADMVCGFLDEKRLRPDQAKINTIVHQGMSGRQHTMIHVYWVED